MDMEVNVGRKPVSIVAIGAGNRTNKYLEYVKRNPDKVKLVGVVELNDIRRRSIAMNNVSRIIMLFFNIRL